ncbi:MAG TPA: hypothetical protein VGD91_30015, partial [Trebonia sp.]
DRPGQLVRVGAVPDIRHQAAGPEAGHRVVRARRLVELVLRALDEVSVTRGVSETPWARRPAGRRADPRFIRACSAEGPV